MIKVYKYIYKLVVVLVLIFSVTTTENINAPTQI